MEPEAPFSRDRPWWGDVVLAVNSQRRWRLGPLTVWIQHLPHEWRLAWRSEDDANAYEVARPGPLEDLFHDPNLQRHCFSHGIDRLLLRPALADRPVVSKPEKPLYVSSGESVVVYLSFPLWLRLEAGEPARLLKELPTLRLSDTWFGPSTREGGLCYASRNFGRLALEEPMRRPHRVLTAVEICNRAADPLCVERINVPLPHLSLYQDEAGVLWTEALTLERQDGGANLVVDVGRLPPPEAPGPQLIALPRFGPRRGSLARAISSLWSA